MDRWLLSFIIGAILALILPQVPSLLYLILLIIVAISLLFIRHGQYLSGFIFGACWILLSAQLYFSQIETLTVDDKLIWGEKINLKGQVVSLIEETTEVKFNLVVSNINDIALAKKLKIRLSWSDPFFALKQGQTLLLNVKLKPPHGYANQGGFSYQTWLLQQHIIATGYVLNSDDNQVLDNTISVRQAIYDQMRHLIANQPKSIQPLILALSLGAKQQFTDDHWRILNTTGSQHIMAISGLHLGLIAGLGYLLGRAVFYILPSAVLSAPFLYVLPIVTSTSFAFSYAWLSGFATPTVRALIMLLVFWLLKVTGVKLWLMRWLLLSVVFMLLIQPFALFEASFWLSMSAVLAIVFTVWRFGYLVKSSNKALTFFKSLCLVQFAITVFLLPISILLYQKVSTVAFLANIVVVPLLSFTAIPLILISTVLIALPQLSIFLLNVSTLCLSVAWQWLSWLSDINHSQIVVFFNALWPAIVLVLVIIGFSFAINHKKQVQAVFILSSLSVLSFIFNELNKDEIWQLTALDVGHGLAVVIEKNGHALLYDAGATYASGFDIAESVISPYLTHKQLTSFDIGIISHNDNDHAGGLSWLLTNNKIDHLISNVPLNQYDNSRPKKNSLCLAGELFLWQKLQFEVLWPTSATAEQNDDSCVILISDGQHKVLLTGDISKQIEFKLLADHNLPQLDLLIAAHHGSKTSSSWAFVNQTTPSHVVFSTGFMNRWRMPAAQVLEKFSTVKSKIYNTADDGMVQFSFFKTEHSNTSHINAKRYRDELAPYWFVR